MRFLSLGGGHEVGASCYFLELAGVRLLVDAGIRVSGRDAGINADALPDLAFLSETGGCDAILVTHAHLDHIGALPLVHQAFPAAPIYATTPTVHLMRVLLADALKLMSQKADLERECPLYDADLVARMFTRVVPLPVGKSIAIQDSVRAHFFPAGHILGAAMLGLESDEGRVLVSGDISLGNQRTIPGLVVPRFKPHLLVLEATYGNRLHANRQREEKGLAEAVAQTVAAGGHALVPAFALGRAQEVILLLQAFQQAGRVPKFPIWVDGMVRSVCQTYLNFPEYLKGPVKRLILNGQNPFYREKSSVQPVNNATQREKVLGGAPCCIVASSGMLTGGPSQFYAARLADDEKNAILLCGYQDEESPGRRLLALAENPEGELLLDGVPIRVKCRVAKYGLSAHADAGELSSLVSQLKPRRVVLVHGEKEARQALAGQLAPRHAVSMPDNGEELRFTFRRKSHPVQAPAVIAPAAGEQQKREIDLAALWDYLLKQERQINQPKQLYTAEELATLWYGPAVSAEQQERTRQLLAEDRRYFASDWKHPYFYRPRRPDLVAGELRREQLMLQLGHLAGHLVLLKDAGGATRAGICFAVGDQGFEAWKIGREETAHPAESLLEIIAPWPFTQDPPVSREEKIRLHKLLSRVKPVYASLAPRPLWEKLTAAGPTPRPLAEIVDLLAGEPAGKKNGEPLGGKAAAGAPGETAGETAEETAEEAVYRLAVAFRLNNHPEYFERLPGKPGCAMYKPRPEIPGDACEVAAAPDETPGQPVERIVDQLEQNAALALVETTFPPGSGLYRKGVERERGKIVLYFHFPQTAAVRYQKELAELAAATGWAVELHPEAHHGALNVLVHRLLPEGWTLLKTPSIYREQRQVVVRCLPEEEGQDPEEFSRTAGELAQEFEKITGYTLVLAQPAGNHAPPTPPADPAAPAAPPELPAPSAGAGPPKMEINQSYAMIKNRLQSAGAAVYRTGKKTGGGREYIEVTFISPQIGEKYRSVLAALATETGWELRINPEPNQNEIKNLVRSRLPGSWGIKKEPGFFKDRQEIRVKLASPPAPEDPARENLAREIYELTGYRLIFES
ncbi:MAG: MBL fold metallo-hydrolase [Bacillota bacterium]